MGDADCDDFGIESAMRRATRIRWQNSRTVPYVAHLADDCAPAWVTAFDRSHPYALACIARQGDDSHDLPWDEVAYDMDRCGRFCEVPCPSPGDDITREASDAMDGYRRSNDSGGGGTP